MSDRRTVVVTGAASGIGRATAKRFAAGGDLVVVADVNAAAGERVVDEIAADSSAHGGAAAFHAVDVADDASVDALAAWAAAAHGPVAVLVNSAGILQNVSAIESFDLAEHDRVWAINYRGTYLCCRAFAPGMAAAGGGAIVNISSTSAAAAFPLVAYGPGKAAIDHLTHILAAELGRKGVRVNAVRPGYVLSEQMQARIDSGHRDPRRMEDQSALGRLIQPAEIADGIHFLASPAASAITGTILAIDAGWLAAVSYWQYPGFPARP